MILALSSSLNISNIFCTSSRMISAPFLLIIFEYLFVNYNMYSTVSVR